MNIYKNYYYCAFLDLSKMLKQKITVVSWPFYLFEFLGIGHPELAKYFNFDFILHIIDIPM